MNRVEIVRVSGYTGIMTIERLNLELNFAKIVAPPRDKNENHVAHLKEQSLLKKKR